MRTFPVWPLLLLHLFLLASLGSTVAVTTNETDMEALLAFKENFEASSGVLSSWNKSIHFCKWGGITCRGTRVLAIDLSFSGLRGSISPFIGNLTGLRRLNLDSNEIYGEIPSSISRLHHLQYLILLNNSISGDLTYLKNCTELSMMHLSSNNLSGKIPSWLEHIPKLEYLHLSSNKFSGVIPNSIGNLSMLLQLCLDTNNLEGMIPKSLGNLSRVERLYLDANNLTGTIPDSLKNLSALSELSLSNNSLYGSMPSWIGTNLQNLNYLHLDINQLTGEIPVSISNASKIKEFGVSQNKLSGRIPPELGMLCPTEIVLHTNKFEAAGPKDWEFLKFLGNCSSLIHLELEKNNFKGIIPESLTNLSQLQTLNLDYNFLSGAIPSSIGKLVGLTELSVGGNHLTSIIPESIGKLHNLQFLNLLDNNLSGPIPPSLGNLTRLFSIYLGGNSLAGPIPPSMGELKALTTIDLSENFLSGTLPNTIFKLPSLSYLYLHNNSLVGPIPIEIGSLKTVGEIFLSGNSLSGELPDTLSGCVGLEILSLDTNNFTGSIPKVLGNLKGIRALYLSDNSLSGNVPAELGSIQGLLELNLSQNKLSGIIPEAFENLKSLYLLDLSFNNLEGEVPTRGFFRNSTALFIQGNPGLCGGIPELKLGPCSPQHERKSSHLLLHVVIITVSLVLCLIFFSIVYFVISVRSKSQNRHITRSVKEENYPRVSYGDLVKATDGFATENLVGAGKFGSVYKGNLLRKIEETSEQGSLTVAVKIFNLKVLGGLKSFVAECEVLRNIRHRNLIRIITCCSSIDFQGNDFKALVFDFMPYGNLDTWLHSELDLDKRTRSLNLIQRLNIAVNIADALDYLHNDCHPSIIHCDMKPSNILLDKDLTAFVGDFGLAKFLSEAVSKSWQDSESIMIRGSIGYIAPECGVGVPVTTQADVYSFGILLLEMFIGKRPTHDMFQEGLSLDRYAEMAYPSRIMQTVDPILLQESGGMVSEETSECLASAISLGLMCSKQSPEERLSMRDTTVAIHAIRDEYLSKEANCATA